MGTKLSILTVSFFVNFISNKFMPLDWQVLELSIYCLTLGLCWGYNIWLFWLDQDEITAGVTTVYQFLFNKL